MVFMKVLLVNKFFYRKGGDAVIFFNTGTLLEKNGHVPIYFAMEHERNLPSPFAPFFMSNVDLNATGNIKHQLRTAGRLLYSFEAKRKIARLIEMEKPDIAHIHNIYHQISPSIIDTLKKNGIPTVMTLHDYKLTCPAYILLLNGHVCEGCSNGKYYNVFLNRCIKGSRTKSALNMLEMYLHHKILHIYEKINILISPSKFLMQKTREMGISSEIVHLPNFLDASGYNPAYNREEKSIVYFGRLFKEKGVPTLIDAVKGLDIKLKIIGEGPQQQMLKNKVSTEKVTNVDFLGYLQGEELQNNIKKSMFAIIPSEWYENNPRSVIEAFALGKPVVGSRIGGIPELVKDWETGLTFEAGNSEDLSQKICILLKNQNKIEEMGKKARALVEEEFNAENHYHGLMAIYKKAIAGAKAGKAGFNHENS